MLPGSANAAANIVRFGDKRASALSQFIDFDLMSEKMWAYTRVDHRSGRRAVPSKVPAYGHNPVELASSRATSNPETLSVARGILEPSSSNRSTRVIPSFLYQ